MQHSTHDTSDDFDVRTPIKNNGKAQRLLNLLFLFNSSSRPISTDYIVSEKDLGYGTEPKVDENESDEEEIKKACAKAREADERQFRRDRKALAQQGIFIVEQKPQGASESEQSYWTLDRERTFATSGIISSDDAYLLANAIDSELLRAGSPWRVPLRSIRTKLAGLAAIEPSTSTSSGSVVEIMVWTAFALKQSISLSYINAQGEESKREISIYGMFSNAGETYFCGLDSLSGEVRNFKLSRIKSIRSLKGNYQIPADFSLSDQAFMPFDFSENTPTTVCFSFPSQTSEGEIGAITHGRGICQKSENGWDWKVDVRDLDAAACYALSHASIGMRPESPQELIETWKRLLSEAVTTHVCRKA